MKISFKQLLQPLDETIWVDGEPFSLNKQYDNIVKEDNNIVITFMDTGIVHLELKAYMDGDPRVAYMKYNDFINTYFPNGLKLSKDNKLDREVYFGYMECECMVLRDGKKYKRTLNVDNAFTRYKDGRCEHDGINFYITETPVYNGKQKKKKKK